MPNPPKPVIKYGEFPFRLEYEVRGQKKVITDTLICQYDGVGMDEGRGKFRKWKERLASGNQKVILLKISHTTALSFSVGDADYYMGDQNDGVADIDSHEANIDSHDASLDEEYQGQSGSSLVTSDELLKKYHIRIISWQHAKPIKIPLNSPHLRSCFDIHFWECGAPRRFQFTPRLSQRDTGRRFPPCSEIYGLFLSALRVPIRRVLISPATASHCHGTNPPRSRAAACSGRRLS